MSKKRPVALDNALDTITHLHSKLKKATEGRTSFNETLAALTIEVAHEPNVYAFLYQRLAGGYIAVISTLIQWATNFQETHKDNDEAGWVDADWYDAIDAWVEESLEELGYDKEGVYTVHPVEAKDIKISISIQKYWEDLIVGALEGGSNYWYLLGNDSIKAVKGATKGSKDPFSIRVIKAVIAGAVVPIYDRESNPDKPKKIGELSLANIARGEQLLADKYAAHLASILNDDSDGCTADVWFQLCSLGELTYG